MDIGAIISAVYGDKDPIPPRPQFIPSDVDCILVTDRTDDTPGWRKVYQPCEHIHPRVAAKHPKCLPGEYSSESVIMWMDASCRLISEHTYNWLCAEAESGSRRGNSITLFDHPWRNDIFDEAEASEGMLKYQGQRVREQAEHYLDQGHPRNWGLFATGLMIWTASGILERHAHKSYGMSWLTEQIRWTYQDQISHPPMTRQHRIGIHTLPAPLHGSGLVEWVPHLSEA